MEERRKAKRWVPETDNTSEVLCAGVKEQVKILDVSTVGIKVACPKPVGLGAEFYGKLKVHSNIGPFYVRGKVVRVEQAPQDSWSAAVEFDKIRALPFPDISLAMI
jgi:hypothetical protein